MPENFNASNAWQLYSNVRGVYDKYAKASSLANFELRFLCHFIATTIYCRSGSYAIVTREDLWLLHCVASRVPINLPLYIIDRMKLTLKAIIDGSEKNPPTLQQTPLLYANLVMMIAKAVERLSPKYSFVPLAVKYNMTSIGKMGYKVIQRKPLKKRMRAEEAVDSEKIQDNADEVEAPMEKVIRPHTSYSNDQLVAMMNQMNMKFVELGARIGNLERRYDSFEILTKARFDHIDTSLAQLLNREGASATQHMHTNTAPNAFAIMPYDP